MAKKAPTPVKRSRDSEATKAAILDAAHFCFARKNYEQTGLREIAAKAKVDVALVSRYFGSKQKLFATIMKPDFPMLQILNEGGRETLGKRLVRFLFKRAETKPDSLLQMLHSAASSEASPMIRNRIEVGFIAPLSLYLGGDHATERASLICSYLIGVSTLRQVIRCPALVGCETEYLIDAIANVIQSEINSDRDTIPPN